MLQKSEVRLNESHLKDFVSVFVTVNKRKAMKVKSKIYISVKKQKGKEILQP